MAAKKRKKMTQAVKKLHAAMHADVRQRIKRRRESLLAESTLQQRQTFIEAVRDGKNWNEAMSASGINDLELAAIILDKNTRIIKHTVLVDAEKVK